MSLTPRSSKNAREPLWTRRQREVLGLLTSGRTNGQIAEELGISLDGAKWHVSEIITKLGVDSREEAAEYWRAHNGMRLRFTRALRALLPGAAWAKAVAAGAAFAVVTGVAVMVVIALQQGNGDDSAAASTTATNTTSTAAATASATVPATPTRNSAARRTGDPSVDGVIDTILARDLPTSMSLLERFPEPCATNPQGVGSPPKCPTGVAVNPQGVGSPPKCPTGVADGSQVLTFRRMGPERGYDDDLDGVLQFLFTRKCSLYAVFQSSQPKPFDFVPVGDYSVVFVADLGFPTRYEVTGERIVGMWMGQSGDLALQRMLADANGVFVVPPPTEGG